MKKKFGLIAIIPLMLVALSGCSSTSGQQIVPPPEENTDFTDEVYLGLFETKDYVPSTKTKFEVEIDNEELVKYFDGQFITNINEGTTLAHFTSPAMKYTVTVNVRKDSTVPYFSLSNQDVSVYKNSSFKIDTNLTYRGVDVKEHIGEIKVTKETNNNASSIEVNDSSLIVTGLNNGVDEYTVYTEFSGFTLSKRLKVTTCENSGLVICGHELFYDENGPAYNISMYQYDEHKINLRDDIIVLKTGEVVPFDSLDITFTNPSVLSINSTTKDLIPNARGESIIRISYLDESIDVKATVYKPVLSKERVELADPDFDLNMQVTVGTKRRTYSATNKNKVLTVPGSVNLLGVTDLYVGGQPYSFTSSTLTYNTSTREVTLKSSLFSVMDYGNKLVELTFESADALYTYAYMVNFITKAIGTVDEFITYLRQIDANEAIYGQYILGNDIDFANRYSPGEYIPIPTIDYNFGFKGIFDGRGHTLSNFRSTMYGLFIMVGTGAVIKNFNYSNIHYQVRQVDNDLGHCLLGRFMSGITVSNIKLELAPDSVTDRLKKDGTGGGGPYDSVGLFSTEVFNYSVITDITINVPDFNIFSIFGKNVSGNVYSNVTIKCKSLNYVGYRYTSIDGVNVVIN
ncbi:MAG: hypothetical protein J6M95_01605 [Bacilli bacterium]|nr:hypothetical protein [Bacilli bacterium]